MDKVLARYRQSHPFHEIELVEKENGDVRISVKRNEYKAPEINYYPADQMSDVGYIFSSMVQLNVARLTAHLKPRA